MEIIVDSRCAAPRRKVLRQGQQNDDDDDGEDLCQQSDETVDIISACPILA